MEFCDFRFKRGIRLILRKQPLFEKRGSFSKVNLGGVKKMEIKRFGYAQSVYAVIEWDSKKESKIYFGADGVLLDGFDKAVKDKIKSMILEKWGMLRDYLLQDDNLMESQREYARKCFRELESGVKDSRKKRRKVERTYSSKKFGVYL